MSTDFLPVLRPERPAWNKGRIVGQKRPLLPKHVWSIRVRLEMANNKRAPRKIALTGCCGMRPAAFGCWGWDDGQMDFFELSNHYAILAAKKNASVEFDVVVS